MSRAFAPGKVILFGEHAVVYGRPALAVPVTQVQAEVEVLDSTQPGVWIDAPQIDLHAELSTLPADLPMASVIRNVFQHLGIFPFPPLTIKVASTIPVASGLGSGAAVSVALIRALSLALGCSLSDEVVNALAYEAEKWYHGTPSGIDNTVITYAQPVYFIKGQPLETFHAGKPFSLAIADTGVSASTKEAVGEVRKLWQDNPPRWEKVFDEIGEIVRQARQAIEDGETQLLGPLMNANHVLLQEMTVSSSELDRLVMAARSGGALGAKLSGGGRGGNIIALLRPDGQEQVTAALRAAGARNVIVTQVG